MSINSFDKFFDRNYLILLLGENSYIKRGDVHVAISSSNRGFSKSIYVNFYKLAANNKWIKRSILRISDHFQNDCPFEQVIIGKNVGSIKNKREEIIKKVNRCIKITLYKNLNNAIKILNGGGSKSDI